MTIPDSRESYAVDIAAGHRPEYACARAGFAASDLVRLQSDKVVIARIAELMGTPAPVATAEPEHGVTTARLITELANIAFLDPGLCFSPEGQLLDLHLMPEPTRRAISSFDVKRGRDGSETVTVKFFDKIKGISLVGNHLGTFEERTKDGGIGIDDLPLNVLQEIRARAQRKLDEVNAAEAKKMGKPGIARQ